MFNIFLVEQLLLLCKSRPRNNTIFYEPSYYSDFKEVFVSVKSIEEGELSLNKFKEHILADCIVMTLEKAANRRISKSECIRLIVKYF